MAQLRHQFSNPSPPLVSVTSLSSHRKVAQLRPWSDVRFDVVDGLTGVVDGGPDVVDRLISTMHGGSKVVEL